MAQSCPNCHRDLDEVPFGDQSVDKCGDCGGIFFDSGELEAIVEMMRVFVDVELDEDEIDAVPSTERSRLVECPGHRSSMTPRQVGTLTIDECKECGGIWLDGGELAALMLAEQEIRDNLNLYIRLGQ